MRRERLAHRHEQVPLAARGLAHTRKRRFDSLRVPLRAHPPRPLDLAPLGLRVEAVQLDLLRVGLAEAVHADDDLLARLDLSLVLVGGLLDLVLREALLDG